LVAAHEAQIQAGYGWKKQVDYTRRFLGRMVEAGAAATAPPNRALQVLPDNWQFTWDEAGEGEAKGFHTPGFDDSKWKTVATYSKTLDAQGLPDKMTILWYRTRLNVPAKSGKLSLFFAEVDGDSTVFVNGEPVGGDRRRRPYEVDVTDAARPGENLVAVRVDHSTITDLFLGGIIRPVLLVQRPE